MKLAFKKIAMLGILSLAVLALVGCVTTTTTTATSGTTTTTPGETTTTTTQSDAQKVQAVLDALSLGDISAVTADIDLPHPTTGGVTVVWTSSNQDWVTNQGEITVPKYTEGAQTVTLTATVTLNAVTLTKGFEVTVATETLNTFLTRAGNAIIITGSDNITASFKVPAASLGATITWASGNTDFAVISETATAGYYDVTITRPSIDDGGENTSVTLTATIAYGDGSITMEKPIRIIAEAGSTHVTTIADAMALGTGVYTTYEGMTVIGIESSSGTPTGFFFTDGVSIQFVYNAATAATVTVGGVYDITGSYVWYYNAPEVANDGANVVKVKASAAAAKTLPTTVATLAEAVGTRPTPTAENPAVYQAFTLTAKVMVIAGGRNGVTTNTTYLVPADYDISSGVLNPAVTPCIRVYYKSNMDAVTAAAGQVVSITVMLQSYHTSYADWYGDFFGTVDDIEVTFANDQDAIDAAFASLIYPSSILENTTLTLPASAFGVALSYASDNEAVINPTTGAVDAASLTGQVTVHLTVTATRGTTTDTQVFTIKVGELPITQMSDVFNDTLIPKGNVIRIQGILTGATVATSYFIQDGTAGLDVYSSDATIQAWFAAHVGQMVELIGVKDVYNGLYEIKTITSYSVIDASPTPVVPISLDAVVFNNTNLLPYQARLVSFQNFILTADPVVDPTYGNVTFTLLCLANGNTINVKWDSRIGVVADMTALLTSFHKGDSVNIVGGILNWSSNKPIIGLWNVTQVVAGTAATDADYANFDALKFPATLSLDTNYVFPTLAYATVAVKSIAAELTGYVADGTTQLTITNPAAAVTGNVVLTLTYNTASVDVTIAVTVNPMTDAQKLAADQAALTLAATANELDSITLPATGTMGSGIAWEITVGAANAAIASGKLNCNFVGTAYSLTVRATLTIGTETALTKDFTIAVSPLTIITELGALNKKTDGTNWDVANATGVYLRGVVTAIKGTSGVFIQDADGDGMYCYGINATTAGLSVGDEIIVKGNTTVYTNVRELEASVLQTKLDSGKDLVYTTLTIAQVEALFTNYWEYQGKLVTVTGLTVNGFSGNYMNLNWVNVSSVQHLLSIYYKSNLLWTADVYAAGNILPEFSFVFYNVYINTTSGVNSYNVEGVSLTMTDQQKADYDISKFPATLELTLDYTYPTAKYGSTFSSVIGEALNGYLANATDGYTVTLPTDSDKVGTVTVTATVGSATASKEVAVTVKYLSDADKIAANKTAILAQFNGKTYNPGATLNLATAGLFGVSISWSSDNVVIDSITGVVGSVTADTPVILTATISVGSTFDTAVCNVTVSQHVLYYYTGFEDLTTTDPAGLSGYSDTSFVTNSKTWNCLNAYRGTETNDHTIGTVAVRMKSLSSTYMAYIASAFTVTNLSKITLSYADYGTHYHPVLYVQISKDGTNWVTVYSVGDGVNTPTMTQATIVIDYANADVVAAGITSSDALYVRFGNQLDSSTDQSLDIDEINLYRIPA